MFISGFKEAILYRLIDITYNYIPLYVHFSLPSSILLASKARAYITSMSQTTVLAGQNLNFVIPGCQFQMPGC